MQRLAVLTAREMRCRALARRGALLAAAALALCGAAGIVGAQSPSAPSKGSAKKPASFKLAGAKGGGSEAEQPTMLLTGVRAVVSVQGSIREKINAEWAQLGEIDHILSLREMSTEFFDGNARTGSSKSGSGTVWLLDEPAKGISRNDMALADGVTYAAAEGWELETPEMRYSAKDSLLTSTAGFTKTLVADENRIKATGERFEIKLHPSGGSFRAYPKEYGNPLVYEITGKAGNQP